VGSLAHGSGAGFWTELRAGLTCIRRQRVVLVAVGSTVALGIVAGATDAPGTPVIKALGVDEGMLGPSFTALGLGYVAAALAVGQSGQRLSSLAVFGMAMLGLGLLFVLHGAAVVAGLTGAVLALLVAYPARLLFGVGYGSSQVPAAYALQQQTPAELMGRVSATARTLGTIVPLPAPLLAAVISEWWGLGQTYAAAGLVLVATASCVLWPRGVGGRGRGVSGRHREREQPPLRQG
jgi:MFS family permease